ncbi:hypothetical protein DFH08DRAFT_815731 [Mycena albidolilacea]|uniref:Uncharacterized protein n=1 Tax=Mycena albidolilacea TaxID=1033008 RepID=A0AAD6ZM90_9AGAR|nr:hypothetical protein DFH08DRAFT_815731 [Mycena albidolilacea]
MPHGESSVLITGTSIGFEAARVPASLLILSLLREGPATDIVKLLDSRPEINMESVVGKKIDRAAAKGHIRLEGIHFRYPTRPGVRVLRDFSIQAEPGTYVALVRASGCGKSTVSAFDPILKIGFGARAALFMSSCDNQHAMRFCTQCSYPLAWAGLGIPSEMDLLFFWVLGFGHESFFLRDFLYRHSSRTRLGTHCHRAGPAA